MGVLGLLARAVPAQATPTQLHQLSTKPGPPTRGPSSTGRNPSWPSCWPHLSHPGCHQILSPLPQESSSASCAAPTSPQSSPGAIASAVRGSCKLVPIRRQCHRKTPLACPWALGSVHRPSHGTERFPPHLGCVQCPPLSPASMAPTVRVPCSGSCLWPLRRPSALHRLSEPGWCPTLFRSHLITPQPCFQRPTGRGQGAELSLGTRCTGHPPRGSDLPPEHRTPCWSRSPPEGWDCHCPIPQPRTQAGARGRGCQAQAPRLPVPLWMGWFCALQLQPCRQLCSGGTCPSMEAA